MEEIIIFRVRCFNILIIIVVFSVISNLGDWFFV